MTIIERIDDMLESEHVELFDAMALLREARDVMLNMAAMESACPGHKLDIDGYCIYCSEEP